MNDSSTDDNVEQLPQQANEFAAIEITLLVSADPLTKTYCLDADGTPAVSTHPFLSRGVAQRVHVNADNFATEFAELLTCLNFQLMCRAGRHVRRRDGRHSRRHHQGSSSASRPW